MSSLGNLGTRGGAGLKRLDQVFDLLLGFSGSLQVGFTPAHRETSGNASTFKKTSSCCRTLSIAATLALVSLIRSSFFC